MNKWDIQDWKVKPHTFKFRTGDTDEKGGCTFIGGSWVDKTTDELFKDKRIGKIMLKIEKLEILKQCTSVGIQITKKRSHEKL